MEFSEVWSKINAIEGWLTEVEARLLFQMARRSWFPILEIGAWKGRSTVCLALGSRAGHRMKVYSVDPHEGYTGDPKHKTRYPDTYDEFMTNLSVCRVSDIVEPIRTKSSQVWLDTETLGVLWIDGEHTYERCLQDIRMFYPNVCFNGYILVHDMGIPERYPELCELKVLLDISPSFAEVDLVDTIWVGKKVHPFLRLRDGAT